MSRFIIIVLDGFGIGEMPDVPIVRPQDTGANTALKLLNHFPLKKLPTLERLGLINLVPNSESVMQPSPNASIGTALLAHEGGDTFMGHQEIMGTHPQSPLVVPFNQSIDSIEKALFAQGYQVERLYKGSLAALYVDNAVVIADNLEADLGQVYNLTANLDQISFDALEKMGRCVRNANQVGRNIVFGGHIGHSQSIIDALEVKQDDNKVTTFIGVNTPDTGVYENGFKVIHLGFGVDESTQAPFLLHNHGVTTFLYGKVADIVQNRFGTSYTSIVDTDKVFELLNQDLTQHQHGFFCANVQETDLSGHQQDPRMYWKVLERADRGINNVIEKMTDNDVLVVMADHGNDPFIGHTKHTREQVPLLIYQPNLNKNDLGERATMSDVGASACEFFGASPPQNGRSFLKDLSIVPQT
ncbi:phosphopentomutase [Vibrio tapetis]|uniref:Putative mutase n=1 Tax=Vibrio tapetis subsp. tapetis TaxID=1671868 RepID=A0A2N8Z980_9VIBR|nr:phosphopentomutase [Vibrio tapetis]SON48413.1 putative mutase [Vibrio tapetis subsp. tapetis]